MRFHAVGATFYGRRPGAGVLAARCKEDIDLSLTADTALAVDPGMPVTGSAQEAPTSESLLSAILTEIDDMKGEDIVQIDLRGRSSVAD